MTSLLPFLSVVEVRSHFPLFLRWSVNLRRWNFWAWRWDFKSNSPDQPRKLNRFFSTLFSPRSSFGPPAVGSGNNTFDKVLWRSGGVYSPCQSCFSRTCMQAVRQPPGLIRSIFYLCYWRWPFLVPCLHYISNTSLVNWTVKWMNASVIFFLFSAHFIYPKLLISTRGTMWFRSATFSSC